MRPTPGFLVWRLAMRWRTAVDRAVGDLGLTHAQYSVLASLYGMTRSGRSPSQRELADHTGMEPIYVSKLVRSLEGDGLITRAENPADSRAVQLDITAKGRAVADRAVARVHDLLDELSAPLGGVRSKRMATFVDTLQTLLDAPIPPPPGGES
jgi:MarR family transcriptional regulator, organic hydroperoxide resistance regulator